MASKLEKVLNTHSAASRENIASCLNSSLSTDQLAGAVVTEDEVMDAISSLKPQTEIRCFWYILRTFTVCDPRCVRMSCFLFHCYFKARLATCLNGYVIANVLVPILKSGKNESLSDSYHPISLASTFSKHLENIILVKYSPLFFKQFSSIWF